MDNGGWNKGPHNVNIIPAPQGQQRWGLERVVLSGHLLHSLRLGQGSGCTWVLLAIAVPRSCRPPRRHNDNRGEGGKQGLLQGLHLAIYQNFSAEKRATSGVKKPGGSILGRSACHTLTLPQLHQLSLQLLFVTKSHIFITDPEAPMSACSNVIMQTFAKVATG